MKNPHLKTGVDATPETLHEKTISTTDSVQQIYAKNPTPLSQTFRASLIFVSSMFTLSVTEADFTTTRLQPL